MNSVGNVALCIKFKFQIFSKSLIEQQGVHVVKQRWRSNWRVQIVFGLCLSSIISLRAVSKYSQANTIYTRLLVQKSILKPVSEVEV